MASLRVDSELMTNYVSALPVKAGSKFVTCLDPISRRPMVFGISTDTVPVLNVVKVSTSDPAEEQGPDVYFHRKMRLVNHRRSISALCWVFQLPCLSAHSIASKRMIFR